MKLGIIGLPQSGKTTIFEALTKNISETAHKGEDRIGRPDVSAVLLVKIGKFPDD